MRGERCTGTACDVHEILAGSLRMAAFVERCCWLRTCRWCHDELQGMGKAQQMAYKLLSDPEFFMLEKVCRVWGRPITAIDPYEVLTHVALIQIARQVKW